MAIAQKKHNEHNRARQIEFSTLSTISIEIPWGGLGLGVPLAVSCHELEKSSSDEAIDLSRLWERLPLIPTERLQKMSERPARVNNSTRPVKNIVTGNDVERLINAFSLGKCRVGNKTNYS